MADVRSSAASGAAAVMATSVRELEASGEIAAMAMADGYSGRLAAAQTAALGTAVTRAMAVRGSRLAAWRDLVCN